MLETAFKIKGRKLDDQSIIFVEEEYKLTLE